MNDIRIEVSGKIYLLNNNNGKYDRALKDAGPRASTFEVLAFYDHYAGLIQDESGRNLENGQFWSMYENWKTMTELVEENDKILDEEVARILPIINENVSQKRVFLGTLMTIAAAIIAGLFFLFSKDYIEQGLSVCLAKVSGIIYAIFILSSSLWLTAMLSHESLNLDRRLAFYRKTKEDFLERVVKAIRSKQDFDSYIADKLDESKKVEKPSIFDREGWFRLICSLFVIASIPIIVLFVIG